MPEQTPSVSSVSPAPVPASNSPQTIKIFGSNFVSGDTLTFHDKEGDTFANRVGTFVSSTEIDYQFNDASDAGNWTVQVNTADGTLHSGSLSFTVAAPEQTPSVSSVSPAPVPASNSPQTIKIFGGNFVSGDTLAFTDKEGDTFANRVGTFVSSTEIDYQFNDASDAGNWTVQVNTADGTLHSGSLSFTVAAPEQTPSVSSVSPAPVPASNSPQTIKIFGGNFVSGDTLTFHDKEGDTFANRVGTFVSSTEIDYQFNDASDAGNWTVQVNTADGTLHSGSLSFTVAAPEQTPSVSSVSPAPVPASNSPQAIKIFGGNFVSGDTLTFIDKEGDTFANRVGTFVSSTEIDYQFNDASDAGNWTVQVNTADGTLHSGSLSFTVAAPEQTPSVSSVSPAPVPASNSPQTIKIFGGNFVSGDTLTFTDKEGDTFANRVGTFVSSTEIDYQFNDASDAGNWTVQVNTADGTLHSGSLSFTVSSPAPPPVNTVVTDAMKYEGTTWGNENCTGFVFTVSADLGEPFFWLSASDLNAELNETGAYYNGHLLNDSSNGFLLTDPGFDMPVSVDPSVSQPFGSSSLNHTEVTAKPDTTNDNWTLVNGDLGNFSAAGTMPEPGDIFRGMYRRRAAL